MKATNGRVIEIVAVNRSGGVVVAGWYRRALAKRLLDQDRCTDLHSLGDRNDAMAYADTRCRFKDARARYRKDENKHPTVDITSLSLTLVPR